MLQELIYSIFFMSSEFSNFYVFYFHNYFWTNLLWYYGILDDPIPSKYNKHVKLSKNVIFLLDTQK
jgi:hypothetical protein